MFQLCFCKDFPFPYLAPIACYYLHHPEGFECSAIDQSSLETFVNVCKDNEYICIIQNIRAPQLDASIEIRNRYAVTNMVLLNTTRPLSKKEFWMYMAYNVKALRMMRRLNIDSRIIDFIEKSIWSSLPTFWKIHARVVAQNFVRAWSIEAYEVYYCPDYVWKYGKNKGRKTIEILTQAWNQKMLQA